MEAEDLLRLGHREAAVSRAYYAMFTAARALLAAEGLTFSSHSAVVAEFGHIFAKPKLLDRRFHKYLREAFRRRMEADYDELSSVTAEEAAEVVDWAREFLDAATDYLGPLATNDEA
jgi:uncharacterized protein (UPF0332 family)